MSSALKTVDVPWRFITGATKIIRSPIKLQDSVFLMIEEENSYIIDGFMVIHSHLSKRTDKLVISNGTMEGTHSRLTTVMVLEEGT